MAVSMVAFSTVSVFAMGNLQIGCRIDVSRDLWHALMMIRLTLDGDDRFLDPLQCAQGRAAWLERGRRCSVQESSASCHRRWVKRNRVTSLI